MFGRVAVQNPSWLFNCLTFNKKITCYLNGVCDTWPHRQGGYLAGYRLKSDLKNPVPQSPHHQGISGKLGQSVAHDTGMWRNEWALGKLSCRLPAASPLFCSDMHKPCCYNPDSLLRSCQSFQLLRWLWCWQMPRNGNRGLNFWVMLSEKRNDLKKKHVTQLTAQVNWTDCTKYLGKQRREVA